MRGGQGESHTGNEIAYVLLGLIVCVTIYFAWKRVGPPIEAFSLRLESAMLAPVALLPDIPPLKFSHETVVSIRQRMIEMSEHPADLNLTVMDRSWHYVSHFYVLLIIPVMLYFTLRLYRLEKVVRTYRTKYSMESLLGTMSRIFPTQRSAVVSRYWDRPADKGRWASPMHPYVFAVSRGLIVDREARKALTLKDIRVENGHPIKPADYDPRRYEIDKKKALQVFASQLELGRLRPRKNLWAYPFPLRVLSAIFIAKGLGGKGDRSDEWLKKAAANFSVSKNGTPSLSVFDEADISDYLKKMSSVPDVRNVLNSHAYLMPTMMSLLLFARRRGVLIGADFLWLRPMDTTLWRSLNQTGNTVAWVEAAGVMAHWQAEMAAAQYAKKPTPLIDPAVDQAVVGLEILLKGEEEGWLFDLEKNKRG